MNPHLNIAINIVRKLGKNIISGKSLSIYQAAEQFRLYTGKELSNSGLIKISEAIS